MSLVYSFSKRIRHWFVSLLKTGLTPHKASLAIAFGICIGIIPLLGVTSLLCMLTAFLFRLNMAVIQGINYFVYPLQLFLFIPFLKAGDWILGQNEFQYSLNQITTMFSQNTIHALSVFLSFNLQGLVLWLVLCPFLFGLFYFTMLFILKFLGSMDSKTQAPLEELS